MEYKYFRWNVIIRISLIILFGYGAVYVITQTHFWLVSFWLILGLIITLVNLIRYVERSRRELANFLLAIKQQDFSNTYHHKNEQDLNYAFHEINQVLKTLRNEKASNLLYLQTIVEHVRVALVCFDDQMRVQLVNHAAQDLFNKSLITTIRSLEHISGELLDTIKNITNGERELVKLSLNGKLMNLSIQATEFKLQGEAFKLISFQDIKSELEANEIESWQKLIRVLTHEIKNSVIPISTLSDVILQMIKDESGNPDLSKLDDEGIEDLVGGLETIESRSKGLANFVKTYDQLTKVPKPDIQSVKVESLIGRLTNLFKADIDQHAIRLEVNLQEGLEINIDSDLIDQVLINLFKNAIEALQQVKNPVIRIEAQSDSEETTIMISDNGPGIPDEIAENIFVPFYTTKVSGSGIGLSLSRQIMRLHKGSLEVRSSNNRGTTFFLKF
ncbi:PAS domain-containing sensor histidine kinase [Roseivirga sp. E12]|uniref:sensor histidine kinase n=1 Tax=Roseivirga sp. E12 TaxID=2819237 RepID=UPI001ABC2C12|nr:ATP-binding protein [Roseivirga sp. E12]MBO3697143.1 GHKL domain-containing protein [Roseivirga sp. E12]